MKTPLLILTLFGVARSTHGVETAEERLRMERDEIQQIRRVHEIREREVRRERRELRAGLDKLKGVSSTCPVHKVKMRAIKAEIVYGMALVQKGDPPPEIRKREFPFALDCWKAGCLAGKHTHAQIYVCSACQKAEKSWRSAHAAEREHAALNPSVARTVSPAKSPLNRGGVH